MVTVRGFANTEVSSGAADGLCDRLRIWAAREKRVERCSTGRARVPVPTQAARHGSFREFFSNMQKLFP
jgi:hypothetical protein